MSTATQITVPPTIGPRPLQLLLMRRRHNFRNSDWQLVLLTKNLGYTFSIRVFAVVKVRLPGHDDTLVLELEPLHGVLLRDALLDAHARAATLPLRDASACAGEADEEIHAIDTYGAQQEAKSVVKTE